MTYAASAPGRLCIAADVTGTSAAHRQSACGAGPAAQCGDGAGGGVLYLWPQMRLVGLGYRYSKLLAQRTQVLQRQKELQVELSSLRQLRRIEDIAAQHLGLRPPQAKQVFYVRSGQQAVGQRRP